MVVTKKCKFCAGVRPINLTLDEEILGKNLGAVIENISGVELATLVCTQVIVCQECAVSLVATENKIVQLRENLKKLRKRSTATPRKSRKKLVPENNGTPDQNESVTEAPKKKQALNKTNALSDKSSSGAGTARENGNNADQQEGSARKKKQKAVARPAENNEAVLKEQEKSGYEEEEKADDDDKEKKVNSEDEEEEEEKANDEKEKKAVYEQKKADNEEESADDEEENEKVDVEEEDEKADDDEEEDEKPDDVYVSESGVEEDQHEDGDSEEDVAVKPKVDVKLTKLFPANKNRNNDSTEENKFSKFTDQTPKKVPKKRKQTPVNAEANTPIKRNKIENPAVIRPDAEFSELISFLSSTASDLKESNDETPEKKDKIKKAKNSKADLPRFQALKNNIRNERTESFVEDDQTPAEDDEVEVELLDDGEHETTTEQQHDDHTPRKQPKKKRKRHNTNSQSTDCDQQQQQSSTCVICGKSYGSVDNLRKHMNKHHLGVEDKHCPNCNRHFRSLQKFESHVFNEKCKNAMITCQIESCGKRFTQKGSLGIHMQRKHGIALA